MEMVVSLRQGVKIYQSSPVVDKFKFRVVIFSDVFMMFVLACWFASNRHSVRLLSLISYVFAASNCVKEGLFCLKCPAEVRSNFSF